SRIRFQATIRSSRSTTYMLMGRASKTAAPRPESRSGPVAGCWGTPGVYPLQLVARRGRADLNRDASGEGLRVLFRDQHAVDAARQAGLGVDVHDDRGQARVALRRLEARGHRGEEALQDRLL